MTRRRPVLIVFARSPRLGTVKSRLAAGIGDSAALHFYQRTTGNLLRRLSRDPRWRTVLAITPDGAATRRMMWDGEFVAVGQGSGDLGERMERALTRLGAGPVLLIGSDIPDIQPRQIAAGIQALGNNDFVFGPSDDGGSWLVGARHGRKARGLFRDVRWSGPHALPDTLRNAKRGNGTGRVALLEELVDIDTEEDLRRWRASRGYFS